MTPDQLLTIIGSTVSSVAVFGIALAVLILRAASRLDADRRAYQAAADADRRAFQAAADTDRRAFQTAADTDRRAFQTAADTDRRAFHAAMDAFRTEMQRLAERQSHVEGRVAERGAAAD